MRKLILTAAAALIFLLPSAAQAAIVHAEGGAGSRGHMALWQLDYDTVSNDLTITATHTKFDGSPAIGEPQKCVIVLIRPNGQERPFNIAASTVTLGAADGFPENTVVNALRAPSDNQFGLLNKGPQTFQNIASRVSADRASLLEFRMIYVPPAGA